MPIEESKMESFDESVETIAEKIRAEKGQEDAGEQRENSGEQQREAELEKIRTELQESYGDTGGSGGSNDDDDDDEEEGGEEFDSTTKLKPAKIGDEVVKNYLEKVPEKYKEPVGDLVQKAVHNGITGAVAKAQKKNDPYLVDVFHDSLAQLLHQRMQDQGLL